MRLNSTDCNVQRSAEHWTFCVQVIVSLLVSVFMVGFKTNAVRNIYYGLKRKKEVLSLKQHLSEAQSPPRLTIEALPANSVEDAGAAAAAAACVRTPRALQSSQAQNRRVSDIHSKFIVPARHAHANEPVTACRRQDEEVFRRLGV